MTNTLLLKPNLSLTNHFGLKLNPHKVLERISQLAFCITDSKGNFVEINDAYTKLYGYTEKELIGKHFTMVVPFVYQENAAKLHDLFIQGTVELPAEWLVRHKDGTLIRILAEAIRVQGDEGTSKLTVIEQL